MYPLSFREPNFLFSKYFEVNKETCFFRWFSDTEDSKVLPKALEVVEIQHLCQYLKKVFGNTSVHHLQGLVLHHK